MSEQQGLPGMSQVPDGTNDAFYTPMALARKLVDLLPIASRAHVVEPSVGGGSFARAIAETGKRLELTTIDVNEEAEGHRWADIAHTMDFLDYRRHTDVHWVVGNPPFGGPHDEPAYLGALHAVHAIKLARRGVAMLLPLSWIGVEQVRKVLLEPHPPDVVYPIVGRPWSAIREVAFYVWADQMGIDGERLRGRHGCRIGPAVHWKEAA